MKRLAVLCLSTLLIPQAQSSDRTVTLVFKDRNETVRVEKARAEHAELQIKPVLTEIENSRLVALVAALGTLPEPAKCITWEQHVAEVTSWWAAPEREYVPCDDPRVGPPQNGRKN